MKVNRSLHLTHKAIFAHFLWVTKAFRDWNQFPIPMFIRLYQQTPSPLMMINHIYD